jgi:hypothetical protein
MKREDYHTDKHKTLLCIEQETKEKKTIVRICMCGRNTVFV